MKLFSLFARDRRISSSSLKRYSDSVSPYIIEEGSSYMTTLDIFSRLMKNRIIFLGEPINDEVSNIIVAQLLYLSAQSNEDISLYINTPGGIITSGMAIYDTMQLIKPDVSTVCTGLAASMGSILLCAGTKGKRYMLPHSKCLIHQPLGGASGQASDIIIEARELEKARIELFTILSECSNKSIEEISRDADRDYWMTAKETLEYGLIDQIKG